jgi:hypothetical protein
MPLTPMRIAIATSLVTISGILCVPLGIIGVFGLSFGGPGGFMDNLFLFCLFFFPFPRCLISLGSLRWATALMWINLIFLCLCNLSLDGSKSYFNPLDNLPGTMNILATLLTTIAFLAVAAGRWTGNTGLLKVVHSLYDDVTEKSK